MENGDEVLISIIPKELKTYQSMGVMGRSDEKSVGISVFKGV